jgi:hypothetical protein
MPNPIKYTAGTETLALKKGNFYIGTGDVGKGPSDTTGYYQGPSPTSGGYVIYLNKEGAPGGLSYHSAANDAQLIAFTNNLAGQSYTTVNECLVYFAGQSDKVVLNRDYEGIVTDGLVLNLDAGFTPSYPRSGTTWSDVSLSGNNGTLTNGPTFNSDNGGSIVFDGSNDYCNIGPTNIIIGNNSSKITYCQFIKFTSTVRMYSFALKRVVGGTLASLELNHIAGAGGPNIGEINCFYRNTSDNGFNYLNFNDGYNDGQWYYVVATISETEGNLYINGELKKTVQGGILTTNTNNADATIGSFDNTVLFFNGNVALTQIYNRALSAEEVLQNYNAQKGRFGL